MFTCHYLGLLLKWKWSHRKTKEQQTREAVLLGGPGRKSKYVPLKLNPSLITKDKYTAGGVASGTAPAQHSQPPAPPKKVSKGQTKRRLQRS